MPVQQAPFALQFLGKALLYLSCQKENSGSASRLRVAPPRTLGSFCVKIFYQTSNRCCNSETLTCAQKITSNDLQQFSPCTLRRKRTRPWQAPDDSPPPTPPINTVFFWRPSHSVFFVTFKTGAWKCVPHCPHTAHRDLLIGCETTNRGSNRSTTETEHPSQALSASHGSLRLIIKRTKHRY